MTNEWININDKFPPEDRPVLCFLDFKEDNDPIKKIEVLTFDNDSCWARGCNWMYYKFCITHWMPLPPFPEPKQ